MALALALAVLTAFAVERAGAGRRLQAPGFLPGAPAWQARRAIAALALAIALLVVVFMPLATFGVELVLDPARLPRWQLFLGHAFLATALFVWCATGFAGVAGLPASRQPSIWCAQLGLAARRPAVEIALGVAFGVVAWAVVLAAMLLLALVLGGLGFSELVPREAPSLVSALGALPWWWRLLISVSAGFAEETFFRGFLQPRLGVAGSTALFVAAHLGYQQLWMLLGVTLLSLGFALLAAKRQSVWAAIAAHATFDAIQLLWLLPAALRAAGGAS
jgi:membrane protease YdiL (CAAX protease family)